MIVQSSEVPCDTLSSEVSGSSYWSRGLEPTLTSSSETNSGLMIMVRISRGMPSKFGETGDRTCGTQVFMLETGICELSIDVSSSLLESISMKATNWKFGRNRRLHGMCQTKWYERDKANEKADRRIFVGRNEVSLLDHP